MSINNLNIYKKRNMDEIFFDNDEIYATKLDDSQVNEIAELFAQDKYEDPEKIYRMFDDNGNLSQEKLIAWVHERIDRYKDMDLREKDQHYTIRRKKDNKLIGWATLYPMSDMQSLATELKMIPGNSIVISYRIHPDERRKGYGSMVVNLFFDYIFKLFPKENTIYMLIDKRNLQSIKLVQKINCIEFKNMKFYDGRDVSLYSMTRRKFQQLHNKK